MKPSKLSWFELRGAYNIKRKIKRPYPTVLDKVIEARLSFSEPQVDSRLRKIKTTILSRME
jgi:hypothetical protein